MYLYPAYQVKISDNEQIDLHTDMQETCSFPTKHLMINQHQKSHQQFRGHEFQEIVYNNKTITIPWQERQQILICYGLRSSFEHACDLLPTQKFFRTVVDDDS